jgi:hypothetical protein
MEKEKISPLQIVALAAILLGTAGAGYFFFFHKPAEAVDSEIVADETDSTSTDTVKQILPPKPVDTQKVAKKKIKPPKRDTLPKVVAAVEPPTKKETIRRIEDKLKLKKPQTPSQVPEYIPLVYWASREIGPMDPDRGLDWVEEGLAYRDDAAFFSYGAYLHYVKNRPSKALIYAEAGSRLRSSLDKRANALGRAVLAILKDSTDQSAKEIIRSFQ